MAPAVTIPTTDLDVDDIWLGDIETWMRPDRDGIFAKLRAEAPVTFHAEPDFPDERVVRGPGFWAVVRHADVVHVSRHPDLFASGRGGANIGDIPQEIAEWLGSMINMDAPRHTKLRKLVNRGFTPRHVAGLEGRIRDQAREIVAAVAPLGECDFVADIAAALPLRIICDMLGIPEADHERIFDLTNAILGIGDPEYVTSLDDLMAAGMELFQYGLTLAQSRLDDPTDDIASALMHAEVDGERLTTTELGSFFLLLVVAGNETTRNAISHGMLALSRHGRERDRWLADFDGVAPSAVEEIVRWATPVIHFRRTATADTEIAGQAIAEGDKVVMFYNSANRDEAVFDDPFRFDVARAPNEHVAFGAGGPHFCLGANLARLEITVMFDELLHRLGDLEITGEPDLLRSAFIHGIKRMPCAWTPPG